MKRRKNWENYDTDEYIPQTVDNDATQMEFLHPGGGGGDFLNRMWQW